MKDDIFNHAEARPEWDFYDVYQEPDGPHYYKRTMAELFRYEALYGKMAGRWSYTAHEAAQVTESE